MLLPQLLDNRALFFFLPFSLVLKILNAIDGSTVLPSLIFACNTNGHVPATNVLENGIELLKNH